MDKLLRIKALNKEQVGQTINVQGWVKSARNQKTFSFITIHDGSCFNPLQVIVDASMPNYETMSKSIITGASLIATGKLVESSGKGQTIELHATNITITGTCDADSYPLQKKHHTLEFLRTIAHLRPRTNTIGAATRIRNRLSYATHQFFQEHGFLYIHTPILTSLDCEGAGELFNVTTRNPYAEQKAVGAEDDFFGKATYLTVSGQLNVEAYACGMHNVYTFGPTFRAENSNTARHLAEFWMIEPELAFADMQDVISCAQNYLTFCIKQVLEHHYDDLTFCDQRIQPGIITQLEQVVNQPFTQLTYSQVIDILERSEKKFEYPVSWGINLQTEHERYIAQEHCKGPVVITDYPAAVKAFYMRDNNDGKTVAAFDIIVPGIGEIIGGSQREERYEQLKAKMEHHGLDPETYSWYLDLRRYGTVQHGGFGLGLERLVQYVSGIDNIRDVIPFPRYPKHINY